MFVIQLFSDLMIPSEMNVYEQVHSFKLEQDS